MVFFLKNILIPNVAEKNSLILVEEKKNNLIQRLEPTIFHTRGEHANHFTSHVVGDNKT